MSDFQRRDDFIPYNVPDITDAETNEVVETLKSGWVAKGPRTNRFEQEFAGYLGAKHAVAMNSCTAALHIALLAKGIGPGDEVITTPMTFASTASTIIHTGATPVFADIDYRTGCIDPDEIEKKITSRTKAIVPVHYSGQVCDLDRIYAIADKHGLFVSEDAAHALWSRYKGPSVRATNCRARPPTVFMPRKTSARATAVCWSPTTTRSTHAHGSSPARDEPQRLEPLCKGRLLEIRHCRTRLQIQHV